MIREVVSHQKKNTGPRWQRNTGQVGWDIFAIAKIYQIGNPTVHGQNLVVSTR